MSIHVAYLAEEVDGSVPSVRIIVPMAGTPQAQRGSFCALVDLQGIPDPDALAERLLSAMQRTYYSERGTQSQVIMETMRRAQAMLNVETERLPGAWRAGVVCLGVMADRLALAGLGDAFAFLTAEDGAVGVHPPDMLAKRGLDRAARLELWALHRQKLNMTTTMLAGGAEWLQLVSVRTLAATAAYVDAGNCIDAADGLREQAGRDDVPGVVLVIEPDAPVSVPPEPPAGGAEPPISPAPPKSASGGGLPTAVNASPPVVSAPSAGAAPDETPPDVSAAAVAVTASIHSASATGTPPPAPAMPEPGSQLSDFPSVMPAAQAYEQAPGSGTARIAASSAMLAAGAKAGAGRARDFLASMLPEQRSDPMPSSVMADAAAIGVAAYTQVQSPPRVKPAPAPFVPPAPATGSRARIIVTVSVILLLLVPAVVATLYWRQGVEGQVEAESMVNVAEARYLSAVEALDQGDATVARAMLTDAEKFLLQAEELTGRTARTAELLSRIEQDRKAVERVTPLYGLELPLIQFPSEAEPQQALVTGQDIYVLDSASGEIVAYRLGADGESLASLEGQVLLRVGDSVDGVTVGQPLDLAWQPPVPGYDDKSSLLVLDDANHLFRYNQQVDGASVVDFGDAPPWVQATQIETFRGRLYITDEGGNQIYRYEPGQYDQPQSWFQPTTQVNLANLKTMRIDGDIWLLYDDGKVVRYRQGEQLPYSLDSSVALPAEAADLWIGQDGDEAIYVADKLAERILVFDKESGSYLEQFQAVEGAPLRDLRSLFVDRVHSVQYILTDSSLYQERLPR